ncbi:MAG TPA: lactate racemase domain-containing protein, partial [Planctomycetaceae bacterium]
MAGRTTETIHLRYGRGGALDLSVDEGRVRGVYLGPSAVEDLTDRLRSALDAPLDFPPLEQAVIPDDRVVLVLDRDVPEAAAIVAAIWRRLSDRGVDPGRVTILQPADPAAGTPADPREALPPGVREKIEWHVHEATPEEEGGFHYLATTAAGERVYLSGTLLDADVVVSVGRIGFDPLLGYRGTNSVFYPGLSTAEAVKRAQGQGHTELGPDDERPLRQMVDEVGWLLGTPFTVQAVPAAGGGASDVLAGSIDSVFRKGRELLADRWTVRLPERVE